MSGKALERVARELFVHDPFTLCPFCVLLLKGGQPVSDANAVHLWGETLERDSIRCRISASSLRPRAGLPRFWRTTKRASADDRRSRHVRPHEFDVLNDFWKSGKAPWTVWK